MDITSYLIYFFSITLSAIFASISQKLASQDSSGRLKPNTAFSFLSMAILVFLMGFRDYFTVGVDGENYHNNFLLINNTDFITYYNEYVTEPGFYMLNRFAYILGGPQWLFVISAFVTIYFFYKAISYETSNINLGLAVFIFATTQYFYFFGIMRMGISVAIVAFAYKYILERKDKKFVFSVLIATMFHYSALFAFILIFLRKNKKIKYNKSKILKIILVIPLGFLFIRYFIFPFLSISRYQGYIENSGFISFSFLTSVPLLILFLMHYKKLGEFNSNYQFYLFLFIIKIVAEMFSPLIGIARMIWYVNLSICFLLPAIIKVNKDKNMKMLLFLLTIVYCLVYSFFAYFGDSPRGETMIPYENILFDDNF